MSGQLVLGQQVWAKVGAFPWWPARIQAMHTQPPRGELVYKVRFFNDASFAYLTREWLAEYGQQPGGAGEESRDWRLERAVRMADQAFARRREDARARGGRREEKWGENCRSTEEEPAPPVSHVITPIISNQKQQQPQPTRIAHRHQIVPAEKEEIYHEESAPRVVSLAEEESLPEPTTQNILQLLSARRQEESSEYNYENRKRTIQRKAELKQKLLEKYCLHDLKHEEETKDEGQPDRKYRERQRRRDGESSRISRRKTPSHPVQNMKERCIKKLYSIARRSFPTQGGSMKRTCLQLITRLGQVSQQNPLRFKSLFLALVRSIQTPFRQATTTFADRVGAFRGCLQRFEEKGEDEEGSKMTQVSVQQ